MLAHPTYSPDIAPSDYHLFRSMQNAMTGIHFTSEQSVENWLDSFLTSKDENFLLDRIYILQEKSEKVLATNRQYFE